MKAEYIVTTSLNEIIPVEVARFPSGEVAVNLAIDKPIHVGNFLTIMVQGYEPDTLFIIANLKDAINKLLRRAKMQAQINVFFGFFPNARYDRYMVEQDGFALKVFANMLNMLEFDAVFMVDPHSTVTTGLVDNCDVVTQDDMFARTMAKFSVNYDVLVAPDAGAQKKINLCKGMDGRNCPVVTMSKERELATGEITDLTCSQELDFAPGTNFLIVDDICDGGRTFIETAKVLRESVPDCNVLLYVTHGIFSKGVKHLIANGINHVYTTDTLIQEPNDNLSVYKLFK